MTGVQYKEFLCACASEITCQNENSHKWLCANSKTMKLDHGRPLLCGIIRNNSQGGCFMESLKRT